MEQFFVIIAVVVYWIFRGVAGSGKRSRFPGQDPFDTESLGSGGPIDVVGATRQKSLESQERAIEALRRWEAKQGLSTADGSAARPVRAETVPAAARTRAGRRARVAHRTTAERQRKKAYAEIAQMLDPGAAAGRGPGTGKRFEVPTSPLPAPGAEPVVEAAGSAAWEAGAAEADQPTRRLAKRPAVENQPHSRERPEEGQTRKPTASPLARLESLPLAARAIVYAEILGPPRAL